MPHLLVAILATTIYWHANPILCVIAWFVAFWRNGAARPAWRTESDDGAHSDHECDPSTFEMAPDTCSRICLCPGRLPKRRTRSGTNWKPGRHPTRTTCSGDKRPKSLPHRVYPRPATRGQNTLGQERFAGTCRCRRDVLIRTGAIRKNWDESTIDAEKNWEAIAAARAETLLLDKPSRSGLHQRHPFKKSRNLLRKVVGEFKDNPGMGNMEGSWTSRNGTRPKSLP